jgi:hypothetical protein
MTVFVHVVVVGGKRPSPVTYRLVETFKANTCDLLSIAIFCRLIDEVLGQDSGDRVPMEKVVMLIWQFRDDPQVVKFMTRFVAKVRKEGQNLDVLLHGGVMRTAAADCIAFST